MTLNKNNHEIPWYTITQLNCRHTLLTSLLIQHLMIEIHYEDARINAHHYGYNQLGISEWQQNVLSRCSIPQLCLCEHTTLDSHCFHENKFKPSICTMELVVKTNLTLEYTIHTQHLRCPAVWDARDYHTPFLPRSQQTRLRYPHKRLMLTSQISTHPTA